MISDDIVAINLDCINQEDPTNAKCNNGWAFRNLNTDKKEFVKHDTLSFNCIGNIYTITISQLLEFSHRLLLLYNQYDVLLYSRQYLQKALEQPL